MTRKWRYYRKVHVIFQTMNMILPMQKIINHSLQITRLHQDIVAAVILDIDFLFQKFNKQQTQPFLKLCARDTGHISSSFLP